MNFFNLFNRTHFFKNDPLLCNWHSDIFKPVDISDTKVSSNVENQILKLRKNFKEYSSNKNNTELSIIVPYRNREEHLKKFIPHISKYLSNQNFEILIVEQDNDLPFNIGILRNFGALHANYSQLVHHDIDFLPLKTKYSGGNQPTRLLTNVSNENSEDKFIANSVEASVTKNRVLDSYFSGVLSISKEHYFLVNGFPNNYYGWGEEDNEFFLRCLKVGLVPIFLQDSEFISLPHISNAEDINSKINKYKQQLRKRNGNLFRKSRKGIINYWDSGLNNINELITNTKISTEKINNYNFKHIKIDFKFIL